MKIEELEVKAWKRYGKDRLYVNDGGGATLGYLDLQTGEVHVKDEADRAAVEAALGPDVPAAVTQMEAAAAEDPVEAPEAPPYAVRVERVVTDLAHNRPGEGARLKAKEQASAAPVRTLVARALGVHTEERAWRVGARGERIVAEQLRRLEDRGWTVLHDVPVGKRGANIDHVLIGPPGVFTVNAKLHQDKSVWVGGETVMVSGHRQPYVRNARHEAQRASRLLSAAYGEHVPVIGIVAVLAPEWTIKSQPQDGQVVVTRPRHACQELLRLPQRYEWHALEQLALCARRSTTWQP